MSQVSIPVCPLLSSGTDHDIMCAQEKCGWYVANAKLCAVYLIAYNNLLDIKEKREVKKL